jgi:hypothetical protein
LTASLFGNHTLTLIWVENFDLHKHVGVIYCVLQKQKQDHGGKILFVQTLPQVCIIFGNKSDSRKSQDVK